MDRRRQQIWLRDVLTHIAQVPGLEKLHLSFEPKWYEHFSDKLQKEFDEVFRTLGAAKCQGAITAHKDFKFERMGIILAGYYAMLANCGGYVPHDLESTM